MKRYFLLLWLLALSSIASAQEITPESDQVTNRLTEQLLGFPHEKIYIQTDKSTYLSGERIWLRSHLIDAMSNRPAFISRYVYLELFNPFGELIKRNKIRPDSIGVYSGHIDLEEDLSEGIYTLRAYTRYMRNQGNEAFFKKTITVLDPYSLKIEPIPNFAVDGNKVDVSFKFVDRINGDTIAPDIVTLQLSDETTRTIKPKDNNYKWSFSLTKKRNNRNILLGIIHKGRKYNRYYAIPYAPEDFEVSFHPEGGYLIPGKICQVGFKTINPSGLGEDISGTLYNSKDEEVLSFRSLKGGMGFFHFIHEAGEKYHAVCKTKAGHIKRFDLPEPAPGASTINVKYAGNRFLVYMLQGDDAPTDSVSLLIHNKGIVLYHKPWAPGTDSYNFPGHIFPSGIISVLLLNSNNDIVSERMVFNINERDFADLATTPSYPTYSQRQLVTLTLQLAETDSLTAYDNVCISVVDNNTVVRDTTNNLVSTLLLSSELKGHIESPADYFAGNKPDRFGLDALMLTQGWRRYDIPNVLKGNIKIPDILPEQFQEISGKSDALLRSMGEGEISLYASLDSLFSGETTTADEKGRFMFKVEYPEGTEITVQSLSKKGSRRNIIHIDPESFPDITSAMVPVRDLSSAHSESDIDAYLKHADDEYAMKHGIRTILLEEVIVTAQRTKQFKESKFYSPITSTGLLTTEDIEKRKVSSLRSLLTSTPGLIVRSDKVTTTRSDMPVVFVIDDLVYDNFFDQLDGLDVNAIDNLFVIKDNPFTVGYYPNTSGAVVITTKSGFVQKNTISMNIDRIKPLGYQQPAEFYCPKYDTEEEQRSSTSDLRTTIYWKPDIQFSETGKAVVEFYSADTSTTYHIVGEGVTGSGKMIYFTKDIKVTSDSK